MNKQITKRAVYLALTSLFAFSLVLPAFAVSHNEDNDDEDDRLANRVESREEGDEEDDDDDSDERDSRSLRQAEEDEGEEDGEDSDSNERDSQSLTAAEVEQAVSDLMERIIMARDKFVSALENADGNREKIREASKTFREELKEALKDFDEAIRELRGEPGNEAPVADAQSVSTIEDTAKAIVLIGSDPEGSSLTFSIVSGPSHGVLSGTAPNLTYAPALDYIGSVSFTFKVSDGSMDSAIATVSITVTAVNQSPVANVQSASTTEDTAKAIVLTGSDPEGSSLTFSIVSGPSHGILSGTAPNLTYTPALNYHGPDSFTFKVNDGSLDSAVAMVSISVIAAP
jgi:hypothetical protein